MVVKLRLVPEKFIELASAVPAEFDLVEEFALMLEEHSLEGRFEE